jgi:hypothetical protein
MSDFNKWCGKQNTDNLAKLGLDAWREALKLTRAAWDHQDAINNELLEKNTKLTNLVWQCRANAHSTLIATEDYKEESRG